MYRAILNYAEKAKKNPDYLNFYDLNTMNQQIRKQCEKGEYFVKRTSATNFDIFEETFGYKLPNDIGDLINLFWHPYIYGFYKIHECIILFSCHKHKTESDDDILLQTDGIIDITRQWHDIFKGNINQYLPIGWTEYSGGYILYELSTGKIFEEEFGNDGHPAEEPFAESLKELICGLSFFKE